MFKEKKVLKELKDFVRLFWFISIVLLFGGIIQKHTTLEIGSYIFSCGNHIFLFALLIWTQKKIKLCEKLLLKDEKNLELNGQITTSN